MKKNDIDFLLKPLINGQGSLTKSNDLVTALNISRSKPHKVNVPLMKLCRKFFNRTSKPSTGKNVLEKWLKEGFIDLGIVHRDTIKELDDLILTLNSQNQSTNISLSIGSKSDISLLPASGVTKVESLRSFTAKQLESKYVSDLINWKYTQSRLFLAELLITFPIYVTDTLCIRLRKYPREHWLSPTAGPLNTF